MPSSRIFKTKGQLHVSTFPIVMVSLFICIFVVGVLLLIKILPSYRRPEIFWLIVFISSVCIISFSSLNVYFLSSFEAKASFSRWRYIGYAAIAQSWLLFLLFTFSKRKLIRSKWLILPVVLQMIITLAITLTPALSHLMVYDFSPFEWRGVNLLTFKNGPWFSIHITMAYLCGVASILYVLAQVLNSKGSKRRQLIALMVGGFLGLAIDIYCVITNSPLRWAMLSGATFLITEASIYYAITRHGLLDLSSVAKNQIFNSVTDPLIILDQSYRIIDYNEAAQGSFNLISKNRSKPLASVEAFIKLDFTQNLKEWECQQRFYRIECQPLKPYEGKILVFHEITAQKQMVERLNENLEFKARLLSMIAQDFTGALNSQSDLSSKLEEQVSPDLKERVSELTTSSMATKDLMNNILAWAKSQDSQFTPMLKKNELNTLIKEVITSLEFLWKRQGVEIKTNPHMGPIMLSCDAIMIESVIRNVLTNSIRASKKGDLISITLDKKRDYLEVTIHDEGKGIKPSKLQILKENIKRPFSGAHGFGVGLIVARQFIELHQGMFEIESIEEKGTLVKLTLPLNLNATP